jgi:hypothetical protein
MTNLLEFISGLVGVDFLAAASCCLGCITREDILSSEKPFPPSKIFDLSKGIFKRNVTLNILNFFLHSYYRAQ